MNHPYANLKNSNFWSRAMTTPAPGHIDPVTKSDVIKPSDKVVTMGSCFAQHLSKNIAKSGFCYYVPEACPENYSISEAVNRNYGVFSARYGNVYTAKQALQLFGRAFGKFTPQDHVWIKGDGYVDAFRPQIEPNGFESKQAVLHDREKHLACVRKVFQDSDWLIFTMGLTEAWRSKVDGSIFPVAPGVSGGNFDPDLHEFVNFSVDEVIADMAELISSINLVNPKVRIILTVSPVPLIATYEDRHVWVSTTVSKAVLRVAADAIEKKFNSVIYFPSYEIITSPANGSRYYADDLRQVKEIGVNHVMRLFSKHFMIDANNHEKKPQTTSNYSAITSSSENREIVCDEEEIENAIRRSGF